MYSAAKGRPHNPALFQRRRAAEAVGRGLISHQPADRLAAINRRPEFWLASTCTARCTGLVAAATMRPSCLRNRRQRRSRPRAPRPPCSRRSRRSWGAWPGWCSHHWCTRARTIGLAEPTARLRRRSRHQNHHSPARLCSRATYFSGFERRQRRRLHLQKVRPESPM